MKPKSDNFSYCLAKDDEFGYTALRPPLTLLRPGAPRRPRGTSATRRSGRPLTPDPSPTRGEGRNIFNDHFFAVPLPCVPGERAEKYVAGTTNVVHHRVVN